MNERLIAYWLKVKMRWPLLLGVLCGLGVVLTAWPEEEAAKLSAASELSPPRAADKAFIAVNDPPPVKLSDPFNRRAAQPPAESVPKTAGSIAKASFAAPPQAKPTSAAEPLKLTGVIFNDTKRLAIIEYRQQSTVCHEGDCVGGYTVAKIGERAVRLIGLQGSVLVLEVGR